MKKLLFFTALSIFTATAIAQNQAADTIDLTGAIFTSNIAEAIQGSVPGVTVRSTGRPDGEATIEIRGIGTFADNTPLYIIDGLPTSGGRDLNINDVESVQVLKDAAATAIYGARAANGVVLITTKKGEEGELKVKYTMRSGVGWLKRQPLANRDEYIYLNNMSRANAGLALQGHFVGTRFEGTETNWQEIFFKPGVIQDHNLSVSGGNQIGRYLVSLNYFDNDGTVHDNWFKRYSLRINSSINKGIFEVGENFQLSLAQSSRWSPDAGSPFGHVQRMIPTIPIKNSDNPGGWGYGDPVHASTTGSNMRALTDLERNLSTTNRARGNLYAQINLTDWLNIRTSGGVEFATEAQEFERREGNWYMGQEFTLPLQSESSGKMNSLNWTNTLNINRAIGDHHFTYLLGTEIIRMEYDQLWGEQMELAATGDHTLFMPIEGTTGAFADGATTIHSMISYFTRLNYNFDNRYFAGATIRRDGSSRLPAQNRWGNFPSISVGWKLSGEEFMNEVGWITNLMVRAGTGVTGNVNIRNWGYSPALSTFPEAIMGTDPNNPSSAVTRTQLANEDLKWESRKETNIGFDAGFLDNRLTMTGDYFVANHADVLVGTPVLMTSGTGGGIIFVNKAGLQNRGFELNLGWMESKDEFTYHAGLNLASIRNSVTELGEYYDELSTGVTRTVVGQPLGMFYLIETDGIFQSMDEVLAHVNSEGIVIQPDAEPGDIRKVDYDDDGEITDQDRQQLGNPWPKLQVGLSLGASWKSFDLSMNGYGQFGNDIYNGNRLTLDRFDEGSNYRRGVQPWTPENPNTDLPRAIWGDDRNSGPELDRWLEKGSYFRIRQITLGYTLPEHLTQKARIKRARITITGQNLVTLSTYSGIDPDFQGAGFWMRGVESGTYPLPYSITGGIQLTF
ncbi:MAG: SusC/RagA family TonB-linked outer membrane protein [Bacteroidota bacterium]